MDEQWVYLLPEGVPHADPQWPVLLWTPQGELRRSRLCDLAGLAQGKPLVLMLPMEMLGTCRVPALSGRKLPHQTLAYAVEEQLAAPLESLHLAFANVDEHGTRKGLVIDRALIQWLLAQLQAQGIDPVAVHADADLLPAAAPNAVYLAGRWLLGGGDLQGLALTAQAAQAIAAELPPLPSLAEPDGGERVVRALRSMAQGRAQAIDLLQGVLRARRRQLPWQKLMAGALAMLLVVCTADLLHAYRLEQRLAQRHADNVQAFERWAPGQSAEGDLLARVKALEQRALPPTALQGLAALAEQVIETGNLRLERAELLDAQGWRVELIAQGFADLERLRQRNPGLDVGHALQVDDRVRATLTWRGTP